MERIFVYFYYDNGGPGGRDVQAGLTDRVISREEGLYCFSHEEELWQMGANILEELRARNFCIEAGRYVPNFCRNMLSPYSGKMEAVFSSEILIPTSQTTGYSNPEGCNMESYLRDKLVVYTEEERLSPICCKEENEAERQRKLHIV
jgi:hypothetical protein